MDIEGGGLSGHAPTEFTGNGDLGHGPVNPHPQGLPPTPGVPGASKGPPPNYPGSVGVPTANIEESHWSFDGDLVGKLNLSTSALAAKGVGIEIEKGIYNADSSVNIVLVGNGASASLDTNLITVTYQGSANNPLGLTEGVNVGVDIFRYLGGQINFIYEPPSTFQLSIGVGVGVGKGFWFYSVGKNIPGG
ncbi:MAG: hypothetical protein ACRETA_08890 [Gammaproteobacteria bacterium]